MRQISFTRAVEKLLREQPREYGRIVNERSQFLRAKHLTSFDSLERALPALKHGDLIATIRLLPYLNGRRAGGVLLSVLRSVANPVIRLETAKTLATLSRKSTTELLMKCLRREKNAEVRYWLAYAISCLADPIACELFLETLQDDAEDTSVRSQTAEGLAYILSHVDKRTGLYRRAVKNLTDILDNAQAEIRFWAAFALGSVRARSAVGKLRELAKKDKAVCPGWWSVGVEAADAIHVIEGGEWPERSAVTSMAKMVSAQNGADFNPKG